MNENEIFLKLQNILIGKLNVNPVLFTENYVAHKLVGPRFRLDAIKLMYLFFEVEKEFHIKITQEDVCAGKFATLQGIAEIIRANREAPNPDSDISAVS